MDFMFSKEQVKQAIKAYGKGTPNCYYAMKYKGENQWNICRTSCYTPKHPNTPVWLYDYDAYFVTDNAGKPLDIRISGTKEYFRERLINSYYKSQKMPHDTLCISLYVMIRKVKGFRFRKDYCTVLQHGGGSTLIDYRMRGNIFWV